MFREKLPSSARLTSGPRQWLLRGRSANHIYCPLGQVEHCKVMRNIFSSWNYSTRWITMKLAWYYRPSGQLVFRAEFCILHNFLRSRWNRQGRSRECWPNILEGKWCTRPGRLCPQDLHGTRGPWLARPCWKLLTSDSIYKRFLVSVTFLSDNECYKVRNETVPAS